MCDLWHVICHTTSNSSALLFKKKLFYRTQLIINYIMLFCNNSVNQIGLKAKIKRRGGKNGSSHMCHASPLMIVIRWHFWPPEVPQDFNYEFTSWTWFAAHASSRLFSGRNVDQTRESGRNRAYKYSFKNKDVYMSSSLAEHRFRWPSYSRDPC